MAGDRKRMTRRRFLRKYSFLLAGWFLGGRHLLRAVAHGCEASASQGNPRIALIIDDIGNSPGRARQFLELGIPLTFSILPQLWASNDLAHEISERGHEVMLHQPMEPCDARIDPGPGALYVGDRANRIARVMTKNFSDVPFAVGVNNHMGSKFTARREEMKRVLCVIKERRLFFVDSLTTSHSEGYQAAQQLRVGAACRNLFLDVRHDQHAILRQLFMLRNRAHRYGRAIGIGHPFPETARAIARFVETLRSSELSMVYASEALEA